MEKSIFLTKKLRLTILKRDNFQCQNYLCKFCNNYTLPSRKLNVHHKNLIPTDNREENLITLCQSYHLQVVHNVIYLGEIK